LTEVSYKLQRVREVLDRDGVKAAQFKGVDWFSWITGGGSSVVILTAEVGIAEVLVTLDKAFVLTNEIEGRRLIEEELTNDFEILTSPWFEAKGTSRIVESIVGSSVIYTDRPQEKNEKNLPQEIKNLKLIMCPEEIERYRGLGEESAVAMTEALSKARPEWSENQLAAEGARSLWLRGIHPTLVLVAGAGRLEKHRHPFPTAEALGNRAMMVFCARRHGLYANLTRFISFNAPTSKENERMKIVADIEAVAFENSKPGQTMSQMFSKIREAYSLRGISEETSKQHFGGLTGYLSREVVASPSANQEIFENSVLAWNPTMPGAKIEDTIIVGRKEVEILTVDPAWPVKNHGGRMRPEVLER
jgi:Xaa-Pro aminopeptidase